MEDDGGEPGTSKPKMTCVTKSGDDCPKVGRRRMRWREAERGGRSFELQTVARQASSRLRSPRTRSCAPPQSMRAPPRRRSTAPYPLANVRGAGRQGVAREDEDDDKGKC